MSIIPPQICQAILSIMWKFGNVMLAAFLFILLYACAGVHLFIPHYQNINSNQTLYASPVHNTKTVQIVQSVMFTVHNPGHCALYNVSSIFHPMILLTLI